MSKKLIALAASLFIMGDTLICPSFAQENPPSPLVPNQIVEQLLRATPNGEPAVELSGYIGYATPESVRLYKG